MKFRQAFIAATVLASCMTFGVVGGVAQDATQPAPQPQVDAFATSVPEMMEVTPASEVSNFRIVGSYTSYSIYLQDYYITDVPASLLTHLNYHSIAISENGQCESSDTWADMELPYPGDAQTDRLRGNFRQLQIMRGQYPNLKIMMSIGGWDNSRYFSDVAATPEARERFVNSCITFMSEYLFDGIDIDWRFPVEGGNPENIVREEDGANLTELLRLFRVRLDEQAAEDEREGNPYLLSVTTPPTEGLFENYELDEVAQAVDWMNVQAFGYSGAWSELAAHQAPLYGSGRDPRGPFEQENNNIAGTVQAYLDAGVPARDIVLGVPFFAQAWRGVPPSDLFGLYQPADGVPSGTRAGGTLYYRDLQPFFESSAYVRYFDDQSLVPWMYNAERRIAISYESPQSIRNKAAYVRELGLGGMSVWELSYDDDMNGLLQALYNSLALGL